MDDATKARCSTAITLAFLHYINKPANGQRDALPFLNYINGLTDDQRDALLKFEECCPPSPFDAI
jgi:hypothetical protein